MTAMPKKASARIGDHFVELTDPRRRPVLYPLVNIVTIAICAVLRGADDFARVKVRRHETHDHGHGWDEMRFYYVCPVPDDLPDQERWRQLRAIGLAVNNTVRDGKERIEFRYYILSRFVSAKRFAEAVRSHWAIENRLHWQLDVTFQEDQSRIRKGHADANFSSLRRMALSLLKNNHTKKVGVKNKRLLAALDKDYLTEVLLGK
ncbi:MAG TPA: ISAs1 family transposase [Thermoguttaceae bacterium]|nr:ISAs1 family transposase [Thermoguttaceae bacterium]